MVRKVNRIKCKKTIDWLNCRNYGNYVANCVNCSAQYVGETKNKFSVRWNNQGPLGKNLIF